MRLTTETLMSLEAYAQARVPGECTVQAADLAELCRSYRRNLNDLPEELQALGTMGAAFAGAFAGVVAGGKPSPRLPEPAPAAPVRATHKPRKRKNEKRPERSRGH